MADISHHLDAWTQWMEHTLNRAPSTVVKYRGYLDRLVEWCAEQGKDPLTLDLEDIERFSGLEMHRAGLSAQARMPLVAAVRGWYKWAARRRLVPSNPAEGLEYPRAGRALPTAMSLDSLGKMLHQCDLDTFLGVRDAAILAVLAGTGLRVSGLVSLNESSLMWLQDKGQEKLVIRVTEKGKKTRLVPAPADTRVMLRMYMGHADLEDIDRTLPNGDRVLFVSTYNHFITPDKYHGEARRLAARSVHDMLARCGKRAGVPKAESHPHALRHLYGTELAEEDVSTMAIQELMGHGDIKSSEVYVHLAMRRLAREADKANPLSKVRHPLSSLVRELTHAGA